MGFFDTLISGKMPTAKVMDTSQVSVTRKKTLEEKLAEIELEYKDKVAEPEFDLPENLGLEEIEYVGKTDEEIKALAESSLSDYKAGSTSVIEGAYKDSVKALEAEKQSGAAAVEAKATAIDKAYEEAKESASNDALKRGLARSSIAISTIAGYDKGKADEIVAINKAYEDGLLAIGNKIGELEVERNNALRELDVSYAAKVALKIGELESEREEKIAEAIKYNNSIREKEQEYAIDKLKAIADLTGANYDNLVKQYQAIEQAKTAMMQEKYNVFIEELSGMSRADALKALENDSVYRNNLSTELFNMLRLEVASRSK